MMKPVQARIPPTGSSGAWLARRSDGHRLHAGVDLLGPVGTAVLAPEPGTIVLVYRASTPSESPSHSSPRGWTGYGPRGVVLRGESGAFHNLAHLGTIETSEGSVLREGARIGTIGQTSTPHAHWEVRRQQGPTGGAAIVEICGDPAAWLAGRWEGWDGRCPALPVNDNRTPRACRPGFRGPAPRPFPPPFPERRAVPSYEVIPSELVRSEEGSHGSR